MSELNKMIEKSRVALEVLKGFTQAQIDEACKAIAETARDNAEILAKEAVEETKMGIYEHKIVKNKGIGRSIWYQIKDQKSVGIIEESKDYFKVAQPKGIIGAITPSTNPTLSVVGNTMAAIKGRNTVIVSPHPRAEKVTGHTIDLINEAFAKIGLPENTIQIVADPTNKKSQELMSLVDVVVATGGMGIVNAAYSSGRPAYGVGQGNVQTVIDRNYSDLAGLADGVIISRFWDAGLACFGEQMLIMPQEEGANIIKSFEDHGAYYIEDEAVINRMRELLFDGNGRFKGEMVGKTAPEIAEILNLDAPTDTRVLIVKVDKYGAAEELCGEKLCPVIGAITYDTFDEAVTIAEENLLYQGAGHTSSIYSHNKDHIRQASLRIPVGRLIVNNPGKTSTGADLNTVLQSTSSIGCGSWGNNIISENLTFEHLIDTTLVAFELEGTPPTDEEIYG